MKRCSGCLTPVIVIVLDVNDKSPTLLRPSTSDVPSLFPYVNAVCISIYEALSASPETGSRYSEQFKECIHIRHLETALSVSYCILHP